MKNKPVKIFVIGLILVWVVICWSPALWSSDNSGRNFLLIFDVYEFTSEIGKTIDYFFNKIIKPNDELILLSPKEFYVFSKQKLSVSKNQLIDRIKGILKKDTSIVGSNYRNILDEMKNAVSYFVKSLVSMSDMELTAQFEASISNYKQNRAELIRK